VVSILVFVRAQRDSSGVDKKKSFIADRALVQRLLTDDVEDLDVRGQLSGLMTASVNEAPASKKQRREAEDEDLTAARSPPAASASASSASGGSVTARPTPVCLQSAAAAEGSAQTPARSGTPRPLPLSGAASRATPSATGRAAAPTAKPKMLAWDDIKPNGACASASGRMVTAEEHAELTLKVCCVSLVPHCSFVPGCCLTALGVSFGAHQKRADALAAEQTVEEDLSEEEQLQLDEAMAASLESINEGEPDVQVRDIP
jgi:hypothetical protein